MKDRVPLKKPIQKRPNRDTDPLHLMMRKIRRDNAIGRLLQTKVDRLQRDDTGLPLPITAAHHLLTEEEIRLRIKEDTGHLVKAAHLLEEDTGLLVKVAHLLKEDIDRPLVADPVIRVDTLSQKDIKDPLLATKSIDPLLAAIILRIDLNVIGLHLQTKKEEENTKVDLKDNSLINYNVLYVILILS